MNLREFRALELTKLVKIKQELIKKYPDRAKRINEISDYIAAKLSTLRTYTLADLIFLLYNASKEFQEFAELIPDEKTVQELMRGGEE